MTDMDKILEIAESIGRKEENLRISQAFIDIGLSKFTLEQLEIIQKILRGIKKT